MKMTKLFILMTTTMESEALLYVVMMWIVIAVLLMLIAMAIVAYCIGELKYNSARLHRMIFVIVVVALGTSVGFIAIVEHLKSILLC